MFIISFRLRPKFLYDIAYKARSTQLLRIDSDITYIFA